MFLRFRTDSFSSTVSQSSSQMLRIFGLENFHIIFLTPLLRYIDVRETSSLWLPVKPPHSQGSERACHFACAASAPPPAPPQTTPRLWPLRLPGRPAVAAACVPRSRPFLSAKLFWETSVLRVSVLHFKLSEFTSVCAPRWEAVLL